MCPVGWILVQVWPDTETVSGGAARPPTVRDVLEDQGGVDPGHILSAHKWDKVQLSRKTRGVLSRRLANLNGPARTLQSRYRMGYSKYSEFVPYLLGDGTPKDHQAIYNDRFGVYDASAGVPGEVDQGAGAGAGPASADGVGGGEQDRGSDEEGTDVEAAQPQTQEQQQQQLESRRKLEHPRFYTPRECARLMGFPEDYTVDESNYRCFHQLGNAVVPPVIEKLARAIVDTGVFNK
jgi:site-specific DNA-cytosine methylase